MHTWKIFRSHLQLIWIYLHSLTLREPGPHKLHGVLLLCSPEVSCSAELQLQSLIFSLWITQLTPNNSNYNELIKTLSVIFLVSCTLQCFHQWSKKVRIRDFFSFPLSSTLPYWSLNKIFPPPSIHLVATVIVIGARCGKTYRAP